MTSGVHRLYPADATKYTAWFPDDEACADPNIPEKKFGNPPLWYACGKKAELSVPMMEALLEAGADPEQVNKAGMSTLDVMRRIVSERPTENLEAQLAMLESWVRKNSAGQ